MNIYVIYQVRKYKEFDVIQVFFKLSVLAKSRWFEQNLNYVKLTLFFSLNRLILRSNFGAFVWIHFTTKRFSNKMFKFNFEM